jgi:hypothetical protein
MSLNWSNLESSIDKAFEFIVEEFANEQKNQMREKKWVWLKSRYTIRKNKEIVFSPRDIVDLGYLINSLQWHNDSQFKTTYTYTMEYASIVHEGAILDNENETIIPPRRWITEGAVPAFQEKLANAGYLSNFISDNF